MTEIELHPARYQRLRSVTPPEPSDGTGTVARFVVQRIADWLETPISPEDLALLSEWANGQADRTQRWWTRTQHRDRFRSTRRQIAAAYNFGFQAAKREGRIARRAAAQESYRRGLADGLAAKAARVNGDPTSAAQSQTDATASMITYPALDTIVGGQRYQATIGSHVATIERSVAVGGAWTATVEGLGCVSGDEPDFHWTRDFPIAFKSPEEALTATVQLLARV